MVRKVSQRPRRLVNPKKNREGDQKTTLKGSTVKGKRPAEVTEGISLSESAASSRPQRKRKRPSDFENTAPATPPSTRIRPKLRGKGKGKGRVVEEEEEEDASDAGSEWQDVDEERNRRVSGAPEDDSVRIFKKRVSQKTFRSWTRLPRSSVAACQKMIEDAALEMLAGYPAGKQRRVIQQKLYEASECVQTALLGLRVPGTFARGADEASSSGGLPSIQELQLQIDDLEDTVAPYTESVELLQSEITKEKDLLEKESRKVERYRAAKKELEKEKENEDESQLDPLARKLIKGNQPKLKSLLPIKPSDSYLVEHMGKSMFVATTRDM